MGYAARIVAHSKAPCGTELVTVAATYPRFVHAEFMTHRVFSRNSSSSRAIPVQKMIRQVLDNPVVPVHWGRNQAGMQARGELQGWRRWAVRQVWLKARLLAVLVALLLLKLGLHKQLANRILEPWMWITVLMSSTEWTNFFNLRCHRDAQPEIQRIACMIRAQLQLSVPKPLANGEWHLPYITEIEIVEAHGDVRRLKKISAGKCARVSYLTHEGQRDSSKDEELCDKLSLSEPPHMSPFEHVAQALDTPMYCGNFIGFRQFRKEFSNEAGLAPLGS